MEEIIRIFSFTPSLLKDAAHALIYGDLLMRCEANIAAIDYDPGASEVNQLNRIKLMLSVAKERCQKRV